MLISSDKDERIFLQNVSIDSKMNTVGNRPTINQSNVPIDGGNVTNNSLVASRMKPTSTVSRQKSLSVHQLAGKENVTPSERKELSFDTKRSFNNHRVRKNNHRNVFQERFRVDRSFNSSRNNRNNRRDNWNRSERGGDLIWFIANLKNILLRC